MLLDVIILAMHAVSHDLSLKLCKKLKKIVKFYIIYANSYNCELKQTFKVRNSLIKN